MPPAEYIKYFNEELFCFLLFMFQRYTFWMIVCAVSFIHAENQKIKIFKLNLPFNWNKTMQSKKNYNN